LFKFELNPIRLNASFGFVKQPFLPEQTDRQGFYKKNTLSDSYAGGTIEKGEEDYFCKTRGRAKW